MSMQESGYKIDPKKVILVTGANSGIGFEITKEIAKQGHKTVMVCRNESKGVNAKQIILKKFPQAQLDLVIGDLSTIEKTTSLAKELVKLYPKIDILIQNAGVWKTKKETNVDGLEETFMVNYLSMFILNYYLMPNVTKSSDPRIIVINAGLYENGNFNVEKTPYGLEFGRIKTYADSKLCGILYTNYLANLLPKSEYSNIKIYSIHPGVYKTNLAITKSLLGMVIRILKIPMKSPKKAVKPVLNLCFSKELNNIPNGQYFDVMKPIEKTENGRDVQSSEQLWELSERLTGIKWNGQS